MWRHIRGTRTMPGKYVDGVLQRPKSADKYTETDRDKITDKLTITAVLDRQLSTHTRPYLQIVTGVHSDL